MPAWLRRLRARIKYRHFERDVAREIEDHRERVRQDLERSGEGPAHAQARSARRLGNQTLAREDSRAVWIPLLVQQVAQDARYAARGLRRSPGFTAAAVAMLTLGLGLASSGFSMFNGLFFKGWPVPDNGRVFRLDAVLPPHSDVPDDGFSSGAYKYLREHARSADLVAERQAVFRIAADGQGQGRIAYRPFASDNFIETLRIPLQLGTSFAGWSGPDPPPIVISDEIWREHFGADPNVVGRIARLSGAAATVAGVAAAGFEGLADRRLSVYVPLEAALRLGAAARSASATVADDHSCCVWIAGRIRSGWTPSQVREELALLTSQYRRAAGKPEMGVELLGTALAAGMRMPPAVVTIIGLSAAGILLVLVLTSANVGNIYLARSLRRRPEIVIRLALGASRARIVRQLLTEGLVLAALAGACALAVTAAVPPITAALEPSFSAEKFAADWRVALLTAAATAGTCLLVSLAPALQITRVSWRGATATSSARFGPIRGVILAAQIAAAMVLILSATLIARGISHGMRAPSDFALHRTTVATIAAPRTLADDRARLAAVKAAIGLAAAQDGHRFGVADRSPVSGEGAFATEVRRVDSPGGFRAYLLAMTSASFDILDVRLASGRLASDDQAAAEAVVNETLARRLWPDQSPLGQRLTVDFNRLTYTVVGVTRDAHLVALNDMRPIVHVAPTGVGMPVLLARTEPDVAARLRAVVTSVDPTLAVSVTPLAASVKDTLDDALIGAAIAGAFGAAALALAIIGIFGVFSYMIEERRREIGIRLALGATRSQIRRAIFAASRRAILGGLTAGLILSGIAGAVLRGYLFGLSPADPVSYGVVAVILTLAALAATWIPIRRALSTDPVATLRAE